MPCHESVYIPYEERDDSDVEGLVAQFGGQTKEDVQYRDGLNDDVGRGRWAGFRRGGQLQTLPSLGRQPAKVSSGPLVVSSDNSIPSADGTSIGTRGHALIFACCLGRYLLHSQSLLNVADQDWVLEVVDYSSYCVSHRLLLLALYCSIASCGINAKVSAPGGAPVGVAGPGRPKVRVKGRPVESR